MLRISIMLLLGLIALGGCQKKQATTAKAGSTTTVVQDRAVYETPESSAANNNPFVEQLPAGRASTKSVGAGQPEKQDYEALAKQATAEQLAAVKKTLLDTAKRHGFSVDDDGKSLSRKSSKITGISVEKSVQKVAGKMVERSVAFNERNILQYSEQFMSSFTLVAELKRQEKEKVVTSQGGEVEKTNQTKPLELKPGGTIVGEWQSLREVSKSNVYSVNHNTSYHDLLTLKGNGTLSWIRFRGGQEFSNEVYDYRYNKGAGELKLIDPRSGKEVQTLNVYTVPGEEGSIYIETPGMERLTAFGPLGGK